MTKEDIKNIKKWVEEEYPYLIWIFEGLDEVSIIPREVKYVNFHDDIISENTDSLPIKEAYSVSSLPGEIKDEDLALQFHILTLKEMFSKSVDLDRLTLILDGAVNIKIYMSLKFTKEKEYIRIKCKYVVFGNPIK